MNPQDRNRLDDAIDRVAACMVQVREDEDLALRIASALPERSTRSGWLIPQFAAIAAFAIAAGVWTMRDPATPSLLPSSEVVAMMAVPTTVVALAPRTVFRTQPLEPLEHLEPVEPLDRPDFERSLAPLEAMSALVMSGMDPDALPGSPALVLAPIAVTELPLTAESFSPR